MFCPMEQMCAEILTKPLQGSKFGQMRQVEYDERILRTQHGHKLLPHPGPLPTVNAASIKRFSANNQR